jgi:spore germination cell wall hydrolase CwlJ-like protein
LTPTANRNWRVRVLTNKKPSRPTPISPMRPRCGGAATSTLVATFAAGAGSRELECLATGVYFEAKSEPLAGQLASARSSPTAPSRAAVSRVLLRRAVPARAILLRPRPVAAVGAAVEPAVADRRRIAKIVDQDLKNSEVGNALFFHARYVRRAGG